MIVLLKSQGRCARLAGLCLGAFVSTICKSLGLNIERSLDFLCLTEVDGIY